MRLKIKDRLCGKDEKFIEFIFYVFILGMHDSFSQG
jgi:hypothetical protein